MPTSPSDQFKEVKAVVVRFAGDSGDGIQTIGEQFTDTSAIAGNDISTFPDFPAEIRAPAGSLAGVSGFQLQFGGDGVLTPGDAPDALVAMNPAALKTNLDALVPGGLLVLNTDAFSASNIEKAGYASNPLDNPELARKYDIIRIDITELTRKALADSPLSPYSKVRCKNFFALGFMYWVYSRSMEATLRHIEDKFSKKTPDLAEACKIVLKAGYHFGETTEISRNRYMVAKATVEPGRYRKIAGNQALVIGLIVAAHAAQRQLVYSGYPITPASSILEGLAAHKNYGVKTIQAEDEIAAIGVALGASFAGALGVTATSGPGICLKSEFMNLGLITELPLVICDIQRGGPSTGLPTKTEQGDLLQCMYGRNSDSPIPIVAASSPADCFDTAIEAARIALTYRTPVILMSDLYVANGSEPWKVPSAASLPDLRVEDAKAGEPYVTYKRDSETLARRQAIPGVPGHEHRIGGLEKDEKGSVSYDPENHERMTRLRVAKVAGIAKSYPKLQVNGASSGDLLVLGWGGTYGAITSAVNHLIEEGYKAASVHLRHLNPLPLDLGDILKRYRQVLVPELNLGQLNTLIRATYLIETVPLNKVRGQPFTVREIRDEILRILQGSAPASRGKGSSDTDMLNTPRFLPPSLSPL
jgi:2-oxoglutarate ferredoxin oxidoreductase subunit alpha